MESKIQHSKESLGCSRKCKAFLLMGWERHWGLGSGHGCNVRGMRMLKVREHDHLPTHT